VPWLPPKRPRIPFLFGEFASDSMRLLSSPTANDDWAELTFGVCYSRPYGKPENRDLFLMPSMPTLLCLLSSLRLGEAAEDAGVQHILSHRRTDSQDLGAPRAPAERRSWKHRWRCAAGSPRPPVYSPVDEVWPGYEEPTVVLHWRRFFSLL
jgi:hypothetical protein